MPSFPKAALLAVLATPLAACSGGLTAASDLSAGVYNLVTVNGQPLPFVLVFVDSQNQIEITEGHLTIAAEGDFIDASTYRYTEAGAVSQQTDVVVGKWSQQGKTVTFTPGDGSAAYSMTLNDGTRLSQGIGNFGLVYVR